MKSNLRDATLNGMPEVGFSPVLEALTLEETV